MTVTMCEDKEFFIKMTQAVKENGGYCPCAIEKNEDTLCWCKKFRDQKPGPCPCGTYIKLD